MLVERLAGDAGLDHTVEILGVHREHLVHVAQVDRDAASGRIDLALQRGAGAEGDHWHAVPGADAHHVLDVGGLLRHHHAVGRLVGNPCGGMAVLLADGLRGDEAVAEACGKLLQCAREGFRLRPRRIIGDGRTHGNSSDRRTVAKDI
ncbi:putative intracellular protease/amidase [Bradyrhizobium japonicum]